MKKLVLLISILLPCMQINGQEPTKPSVYPHSYWENVLLRFNRSRAMDYVTKKTTPFLKLPVPYKTNEDVEREYHTYAQEAKHFFKIPESRSIELKKAQKNNGYLGVTTGNCIHLDTDSMKDDIISQKKITMMHEMAHLKNNESVSALLLTLITMASTYSLLNTIIPKEHKILSQLIATMISTQLVAGKYNNYVERRADKQALYGLQCHKCIDSVKPSYISLKEKLEILEDVKKHQQVCSYHKSSLNEFYDKSHEFLQKFTKLQSTSISAKELHDTLEKINGALIKSNPHMRSITTPKIF